MAPARHRDARHAPIGALDLARGLIGEDRGAEALGVLEAMRLADPDRTGRSLSAGARRRWPCSAATPEAVESLSTAELAGNAEACAWRVRAPRPFGAPRPMP